MRDTVSNPHITPEAKRLYDIIRSLQGTCILSGQQEDPRDDTCEEEMRYIEEVTGKLPVIRGLDYIHNDFARVNQRSREWHQKGGIVSICWHWGIPPVGVGYPSSQEEIDVEEALREGSELHQGMLRMIDEVAKALLELQKEDIPVLWRPLHEFDGQWFWWGKGGPDCFIRLWRLLYDRLTNLHGLNNLVWVLGYSHQTKEGWYPGDDCVDIIGADIYEEGEHLKLYQSVYGFTGDLFPIALHENGPLPDPAKLQEQKIPWSWFLTWHTIHIKEQNTPQYLRYVYQHPYTMTLEEFAKRYSV